MSGRLDDPPRVSLKYVISITYLPRRIIDSKSYMSGRLYAPPKISLEYSITITYLSERIMGL